VYKGKHFSGNLKLGIFAIFVRFWKRLSAKSDIFGVFVRFFPRRFPKHDISAVFARFEPGL